MRIEPRLLPAATKLLSAEIACCDFGQSNYMSGKIAAGDFAQSNYSNGTISSATMLMILISGLIAGPAVSL